jgi:hypothetical protein
MSARSAKEPLWASEVRVQSYVCDPKLSKRQQSGVPSLLESISREEFLRAL